MNRFEFVWSLLAALIILSGAVVWTAASTPLAPPQTGNARSAAATVKWRAPCWSYSQHEFKVGPVADRGCHAQAN